MIDVQLSHVISACMRVRLSTHVFFARVCMRQDSTGSCDNALEKILIAFVEPVLFVFAPTDALESKEGDDTGTRDPCAAVQARWDELCDNPANALTEAQKTPMVCRGWQWLAVAARKSTPLFVSEAVVC